MTKPDHHIVQFNFARLRYPIEDPRSEGFVNGSAVINRLVQRSAGFVWVYESSGLAGTMDPPIWNDPLMAVNLSVWKDLSTLEFFVYNTLHKSYLQRKDTWFEPHDGPNMVLWWAKKGHRPTIDEAMDRFASLTSGGANERAFDWAYAREHFGS